MSSARRVRAVRELLGRCMLRGGVRRAAAEAGALDRTALPAPDPSVRFTRVVGLDPVRVLLVGGDLAAGIGVKTRAAALDGAIADLLHERTGRGVTVENRSRPAVRLHELPDLLGTIGAFSFHLVLWTPSLDEVRRGSRDRAWRTGLTAMLRVISTTSTAGTVLLGVPGDGGGAGSEAARINRLIAEVAGVHAGVRVAPSPRSELLQSDAPSAYRRCAEEVLPHLLAALAERVPAAPRSVL